MFLCLRTPFHVIRVMFNYFSLFRHLRGGEGLAVDWQVDHELAARVITTTSPAPSLSLASTEPTKHACPVSWDTRVTQTTINPHTETEYWPRSAEFKAWQLLRRVSIDSCKSWAGSDHSKLSQQKFAHGSVKIWQQCETLVELCYNSGPSLILLTPPSPLTTLTDQFLTRQVGTRQRSSDPGTLLINTNFTINHKKSMYGNVRW